MKLVSVETPEKSVCKMTFSASAEELEAASNAVYERTRATYTIKGFAKGEADRAQIEADRGEHTFWYDAINDLMDKDVPALYDAAMKEHGFKPVDEPSYDLVSVKKDEGFVATATTALQPELSLTQTTGFKTECVTPEVTDKEIDAVLERRRAMAAELVPHKGPAVKGNIVHIDYEGLLEGKPFNGGTAQNQTLQLGSGRMIPGFEEGILGHKGGEEFDIFVTFPARYHVKDLAGKPVVFKIKLHDVCVRQLPALNSDFAKKAANVDTMDEFRAQIRQQHLTFINAQEMSDIIMIMVLIIITAFCRISISCRVLAHHPLGSRKQFIAPILSCLIFCFRIVILSQPADITLIGKPAVAGIPIKRPRKGIIRCHYLWITMLQIRSKPRQESLMAAAI